MILLRKPLTKLTASWLQEIAAVQQYIIASHCVFGFVLRAFITDFDEKPWNQHQIPLSEISEAWV